jgi:ZIP family zinc transporter
VKRQRDSSFSVFFLGVNAITINPLLLLHYSVGLVTFVGYVADPTLGISLAVGIAIHNIPEGLCIAVPIYYSTGSRWKGFAWGTFSGISEPLGALLGWLVLNGSDFSGIAYGVLFGCTAGIMTFIVIDDLLPAAYKHDVEGVIVTPCLFVGMLLIAVSLILFSV